MSEHIYEMTAKAYGRTFSGRFVFKPTDPIELVWQRMTQAYQGLNRQAQYCEERIRGADTEDLTGFEVRSISTT